MIKISTGKCTVTPNNSCQILLNWPTETENKFCQTSNAKYYFVGEHQLYDWDYQTELGLLNSDVDAVTGEISPVATPTYTDDVRISSSGPGCAFIETIDESNASLYKTLNKSIQTNTSDSIQVLIQSQTQIDGLSYYPDPTKPFTIYRIAGEDGKTINFQSDSEVIIVHRKQ